jgi:hypothetical protein
MSTIKRALGVVLMVGGVLVLLVLAAGIGGMNPETPWRVVQQAMSSAAPYLGGAIATTALGGWLYSSGERAAIAGDAS